MMIAGICLLFLAIMLAVPIRQVFAVRARSRLACAPGVDGKQAALASAIGRSHWSEWLWRFNLSLLFFTLWSFACFILAIASQAGQGVMTDIMPWQSNLLWLEMGIPIALAPWASYAWRRIRRRRATREMFELLPADIQRQVHDHVAQAGVPLTSDIMLSALTPEVRIALQAKLDNEWLEREVPQAAHTQPPARL